MKIFHLEKEEKKDFAVEAKVDRFEKKGSYDSSCKETQQWEQKKKKIIKKYRRAGKNQN